MTPVPQDTLCTGKKQLNISGLKAVAELSEQHDNECKNCTLRETPEPETLELFPFFNTDGCPFLTKLLEWLNPQASNTPY